MGDRMFGHEGRGGETSQEAKIERARQNGARLAEIYYGDEGRAQHEKDLKVLHEIARIRVERSKPLGVFDKLLMAATGEKPSTTPVKDEAEKLMMLITNFSTHVSKPKLGLYDLRELPDVLGVSPASARAEIPNLEKRLKEWKRADDYARSLAHRNKAGPPNAYEHAFQLGWESMAQTQQVEL